MGTDSPFPLLGDQPLFPELPARPSFARRIQRAHALSDRYSAAAELLRFYGRLAFSQQHIFDALGQGVEMPDAADPWPLQLGLFLPLFPDFARGLAEISPEPMRDRALTLAAASIVEHEELLTRLWNGNSWHHSEDSPPADHFIALAFLQPYAEWLAQSGHSISAAAGHATCQVCGSEPICSVLRDQDHGARRSLVCSLCMNEWNFLRVVCPACGEERFDSLPIFTPQEMPHVRIDACDTCHHYIKAIDMTKDGLAVPVVDAIAAVSLDLWAAEKGYKKLALTPAGI